MGCKKCGLDLTKAEENTGLCFKCEGSLTEEETVELRRTQLLRDQAVGGVMLTTETYSPDLVIDERLDVVTAECVFGMNIFRDFFASVRDIFGGRSAATQNVLRDARTMVLNELKKEAKAVGANAVVGVRLDYSEISGKGASMLFVVASGTAVVIKS